LITLRYLAAFPSSTAKLPRYDVKIPQVIRIDPLDDTGKAPLPLRGGVEHGAPCNTQKTSENHGSFYVVSSWENDENDVDNHFSHHKMTIFDSEGVYFSDPYFSAEGRPRMG
jgi:uncharacterized protein YvpB